jgi:nicotinate-nucleotide adenylyltransferase
MGGTFDPIHLGHLRAAENAREVLGLSRVLLVPCRVPPHRSQAESSACDRFAMVALATAAHPAFVASDCELRREGPSFTVDTVDQLRADHPDAELVVIVGSDTFPEMPTWKDPERLFSLCSVAVARRPGGPPNPSLETGPARITHVEGPGLPISASDVRQRVREGRSIRYLVPDGVAEHITKRGLYR